jgi:hypothetical protein
MDHLRNRNSELNSWAASKLRTLVRDGVFFPPLPRHGGQAVVGSELYDETPLPTSIAQV